MRLLKVRSLVLIIGVLLLALTPTGEALAQLSVYPPMGCTEDSAGECVTGGCEACEGPECTWIGVGSRTLSASVETGLYCGDDYCPEDDCDNPETLYASGKVHIEATAPPPGWSHYVIVCEAIALCSNPGIACVRCNEYEMDTSTTDVEPGTLECEVSWDGDWQYHIWAVILDESECPDGCDENDANVCSPVSDCNECYQDSYAHAASCCISIPESR